MIKNIVFDFGDIFINLNKKLFAEELQKIHISQESEEMLPILQQYEMGLVSTDKFLTFFEERLHVSQDKLKRAWNSILLDFPKERLGCYKFESNNFKTILMKFLIIDFLNEGGPLFMYTTLAILITCLILIVKEYITKNESKKTFNTIKSLSLFVLVWGFLGSLIGLTGAFDAISMQGNVSPEILAAGLKIALLSPIFGTLSFLIVRIGILLLQLKK